MDSKLKLYRFNVVVNLGSFNKTFHFSGFDKDVLFYQCSAFAEGFVKGVCLNSNIPFSTNSCQSIDGYIWWHSITNEKLVYITDEDNNIILNPSL